MTSGFTRRRALSALGAMFLAAGRAGAAEPYPARPVRIIVPYGPGTGTDLLARHVADQLNALWQRGVVVENRTGAGGVVGTQALAQSAADGYTLGMVAATHVINGAVYSSLSYDPIRDFVFLAGVASAPLILVAPAGTYASLAELLARAREKPDAIRYGSVGNGSVTHLAIELLQSSAGVRMQHVPYKEPGQLSAALLRGEVALAATAVATALPLLKAGKLAAIAGCGAASPSALPDVPPVSRELPGYELTPWQGLIAPRALKADIARRIEESMAKVAADPDFAGRLRSLGLEPQFLTGAAFATAAERDFDKYRDVVARAGIEIK